MLRDYSCDDNLVSVIVPTHNSSLFLDKCLTSIRRQTYPHIELIVVDNYSSDCTRSIASQYTSHVYVKGSERSEQVNFGVTKASGSFIYKVDSDFILDPKVVSECVQKSLEGCDAIIVHNSPDPSVSWIAKLRKFETDMYKYDLTHSSARFVGREVFEDIGGFDVEITAGEDYDFQNKLNKNGYKTGFADAEAVHLGEPTHLIPHLRKYFVYGQDFVHYRTTNKTQARSQLAFFRSVYFKHWRKFAAHPLTGLIFVLYHSAKYLSGALGFLIGSIDCQSWRN